MTNPKTERLEIGEGTSPADKDTKDSPRMKRSPMLPPEAVGLYRAVKVDDLRERVPWVPVIRALLVHTLTILVLASVAYLIARFGAIAMLAGLFAAIFLAPFARGLENLVHGASHRDLFVADDGKTGEVAARLNDELANVLCAMPVGQDVAAFRRTHLKDHHGGFDLERDPCRARMLRHPDVAKGRLPTLTTTLGQLPREIVEFYRTVGGTPKQLCQGLLWHALFYIAPLALAFGHWLAALAWLLTFTPLFALTLPLVRLLAEAGEHDYRAEAIGLSMAERTFAHDGALNYIFHLFGDALHPEHHLWPNIPQYRLRRVRERAIQAGLSKYLKRRTSLLGEAMPYA